MLPLEVEDPLELLRDPLELLRDPLEEELLVEELLVEEPLVEEPLELAVELLELEDELLGPDVDDVEEAELSPAEEEGLPEVELEVPEELEVEAPWLAVEPEVAPDEIEVLEERELEAPLAVLATEPLAVELLEATRGPSRQPLAEQYCTLGQSRSDEHFAPSSGTLHPMASRGAIPSRSHRAPSRRGEGSAIRSYPR